MNHSKILLTLATALASSTASAASGDTLTLQVLRDDVIVSGRAGEIYAELDSENWLPEPSTTVGKATVLLWNRSGTPYVSYNVILTLRCTGVDASESKPGTLANDGQAEGFTVRCGEGNVISATATITRL